MDQEPFPLHLLKAKENQLMDNYRKNFAAIGPYGGRYAVHGEMIEGELGEAIDFGVKSISGIEADADKHVLRFSATNSAVQGAGNVSLELLFGDQSAVDQTILNLEEGWKRQEAELKQFTDLARHGETKLSSAEVDTYLKEKTLQRNFRFTRITDLGEEKGLFARAITYKYYPDSRYVFYEESGKENNAQISHQVFLFKKPLLIDHSLTFITSEVATLGVTDRGEKGSIDLPPDFELQIDEHQRIDTGEGTMPIIVSGRLTLNKQDAQDLKRALVNLSSGFSDNK